MWERKTARSEVKTMEMRVISALYAYPQLERIGRDYEEHVKNKALLSYGNKMETEKLAEYLAIEIVRRQNVAKLKEELDSVIAKLNEEEKTLLDVRYFGKADRVRRIFAAQKAGLCKLPYKVWSERTYYRKQSRLLQHIVAQLKAKGWTEESFDNDYLEIEFVALLYQYLVLGKAVSSDKKERQFLDFLAQIRE